MAEVPHPSKMLILGVKLRILFHFTYVILGEYTLFYDICTCIIPQKVSKTTIAGFKA